MFAATALEIIERLPRQAGVARKVGCNVKELEIPSPGPKPY